ncbi:MAG TPA: response regulator transcription factor [Chloroflexota bacterium]|nr:response regulator transcription factor [Chloroflexota bacterium]
MVGEDTTEPIRILVAQERGLFREALRIVLEGESDLKIVGETQDGPETVEEIARTLPDVAVIGAKLPKLDGIRATAMIGQRTPDCRVLVISEEDDLEILVAALEAGARGFLTWEMPLHNLIEGVHSLRRGEILVPPRMLGGLISHLLRRRNEKEASARWLSRLTKREREVLALLADGADNDMIATAMFISPHTARTHVQNLLGKLGVHSRLEAAMLFAQSGMRNELELVDG